ncbi:hypothetical protein L2E82_26799 [Cichorium intybus]|uniref:Uncharacterized protein n=1 Tax=Cichorium intybus TaxID=13427 RepID=A0ACB9CRV7_CICIN|nr:hypothetical protein L2E82_26799 [Cichorium intybus]
MKSEFMSINLKSKFTSINQRIALSYIHRHPVANPFHQSSPSRVSVKSSEPSYIHRHPVAKSGDLTTDGRSTFEIQMDYLEVQPDLSALYFKWLLWFSLSFYFFAKFLNNHEPSTSSLKKTIISHPQSNVVSRALSESLFQERRLVVEVRTAAADGASELRRGEGCGCRRRSNIDANRFASLF